MTVATSELGIKPQAQLSAMKLVRLPGTTPS